MAKFRQYIKLIVFIVMIKFRKFIASITGGLKISFWEFIAFVVSASEIGFRKSAAFAGNFLKIKFRKFITFMTNLLVIRFRKYTVATGCVLLAALLVYIFLPDGTEPYEPGYILDEPPEVRQPVPPQPVRLPEMTDPVLMHPNAVFAEHIDIIKDDNSVGVLNPLSPAANNPPANWCFIMIHDRLVEFDFETMSYVPSLATAWEVRNYRNFRFTLRDDVVFHNGDRFTARDVANTIELARQMGAYSQGGAVWAPVVSYFVFDDYTIEIALNAARIDFLFNLTVPGAGILNKREIEQDAERGFWVGTGAFEVEEFVPNDFIRFVRNRSFWNEDLNIITQSITLRYVDDMGMRTERMQSGESKLSFAVSNDSLSGFRRDEANFEVHELKLNEPQGVSFSMVDPITGDFYFRMAVAHAIDKAAIAREAAGQGYVAYVEFGTVWGYATEFRNKDIPIIEQDLEAARYYLSRSNYNGEEVEIAAAVMTNIRAAHEFKSQLSAVGINARVAEFNSSDLSAYMIRADGGSQMVFFNLAMNRNPLSYRNVFFPGGPQNRMQYDNPIVTQMLTEVVGMEDAYEREAHFMRMQEIVAEDVPFINIFQRVNGIVAARGIGGLRAPTDNQRMDLREVFYIVG